MWTKFDTSGMNHPFDTFKAWTNRSSKGAIYKVEGEYWLFCWGFLKGHKYKYLKEAMAVLDALNRLGELEGGMNAVEERFGFDPSYKPY